jgi:hypothetical protein
MTSYRCEQCEKVEVVDIIPRRGKICFGCHIKGIRLGFKHGQEDFHGPTIKERQDKTIAEARANGLNPEPVGTKWI